MEYHDAHSGACVDANVVHVLLTRALRYGLLLEVQRDFKPYPFVLTLLVFCNMAKKLCPDESGLRAEVSTARNRRVKLVSGP